MIQYKKVNRLFLGLILFYLAASYSIGFIPGSEILTTNILLLFSQLFVLVPVLIYLAISKSSVTKLIRFRKLKISTVLLVILFTMLIMPLITFINAISMLFAENNVSTLSLEMMKNSFWLNLLLMAVIPAINEEFVFRGIFYHTYRKNNAILAVVVSGALFGMLHLNINQFSYALVLGMIFALLVEATGSIFSSMIAHFVINANSVILMSLYNALTNFVSSNPQIAKELEKIYGGTFDTEAMLTTQTSPEALVPVIIVYGLIAVVTTSLAIGVYIWICKRNHTLEQIKELFSRKKITDIATTEMQNSKIISIPLIIGVLICLSYMIFAEYWL